MENKGELQLLSDQLQKANQFSEDLRPLIVASEKFLKGLNINPLSVRERNGVKYIPISAIETSLDRMFVGLWSTKNLQWQIVANEIICNLELHYFHPIAKVWLCRCGVGAAQIRMKRGSQVMDVNAKQKNALEMDAPHAKADAVKNAAKSIGDLFGRNIGRPEKDVTTYKPILTTPKLKDSEIQEAANWIKENGNSIADLKKIKTVSKEQETQINELLNSSK